jgi:hypothetical protein
MDPELLVWCLDLQPSTNIWLTLQCQVSALHPCSLHSELARGLCWQRDVCVYLGVCYLRELHLH